MLDDAAHGAQPGALSVGFGPVNSPPRLARTRQLSMTTSRAAAAASGPERTIRTRMACPRCSRASALHSPRRRRSVAPQTRSPVARSSRHCMPSQKHPQCFDHPPGLGSVGDHDRCTALQSSRSDRPPSRMPLVPSRPSHAYRTEKLGPGAILSSRCNARKLAIYRPPEFRKPCFSGASGKSFEIAGSDGG